MRNNQVQTEPLLVPEQQEKYRILKIIFYLWLGGSGVLGFIFGGLWVRFKTKFNKRHKFIALAAGLLLSLVIPYSVGVYTHIKYPETKGVEDAINQQYQFASLGNAQNGSASVGINWSKRWKSGDGAITTNTLIVNFKSKRLISGNQMLSIGKSACSTLGVENKKYDLIAVVNSISPISPLSIPFFSYNFNVSGTCKDWLDNEKFRQMVTGFIQ